MTAPAAPTPFTQALSALLPSGFAWPRQPDSVWMRLMDGLAGALQEHHAWTQQATLEWLPQATHTRLAEWEEATGLPDPCFGPTQTEEARRARVLARLRGPSGEVDDASAASPGSLQAMAATMGITATVHHITRFRVGRDRVGRRVGEPDGRLYMVAESTGVELRVGTGRAGERLVERPASEIEAACAIEAYAPARFELVFAYA
ncbi:MAG: hypothetical protein RL375_189 [Pseudomonadota bacterium]|jgi:uncharacterized protein YmfQ (DUF2313 family)